MDRDICVDEESIIIDNDVLTVDYVNTPSDPNAYDLSLERDTDDPDDGFAFGNHLGFVREDTSAYFSSGDPDFPGASTPITMGNSTLECEYTVLRSDSEPNYYISGFPEVFNLVFYKAKLTLGSGFSIPSGTLFFWGWTFAGGLMSDNAICRAVDASSGTVRVGPVMWNTPYFNGVSAKHNSPWTWAVGDTIEISGSVVWNSWDI